MKTTLSIFFLGIFAILNWSAAIQPEIPTVKYSQNIDFYKGYNYQRVDAHVLKVRKTNDISRLTQRLTSPFKTQHEKYRAIVRWIAENIDYDCKQKKRIYKGQAGNRTADEVLQKGAAVCGGYTALLKAMCDEAGLKTQVVTGIVRTNSKAIGHDIGTESNHAWNAVQFDREWYLTDVTWASGYASCENREGFKQEWKEHYFICSPGKFIINHFPEQKDWQLLSNKISKSVFTNFPHIWYTFFEKNVKAFGPAQGILNVKAREEVQFAIITKGYEPKQVDLILDGKRLQNVKKEKGKNGKIIISYPFPSKGVFYPTIYVDYKATITYKVSVK